jgi:nucleotide-binding universal stress UspA family protein
MNSNDTRPIVVGVDGRPGSAGALRYAVAEARHRHASLELLHVVPSYLSLGPALPFEELRRIGLEILDQASNTVGDLDPELDLETVLAHGDRRDGVVKASEHAQLVVIGRESQHGLGRALSGTATAGIAAHASCEVVVAPSFWVDRPAHGRVVVGLKSRHNSDELLAQAFAAASARGAALEVITAWQLADPYFDRVEARTHSQDWEAEGQKVVTEVTAEWRTAYADVPVRTRIVHGPAARVLLDATEGSDLLVISRRKLALPPFGRLGAVGHDLLRLSEVPVLVVPYLADQAPAAPLVLEQDGALVK